ncbi:acyl-CoA desaturase [Nocardioides agariphilus]|uniref:Acyl-CoA desaturase n=1 Tax=Nocardioides agariphilus TaxID=433664 RepID=A0A930VGH9_9ACTN|nr:acyl-CoA desaturase [Nocardioides agariphilus]
MTAAGIEGPSARLGPDAVATLGRELDAIRQGVIDTRGARDAAYIRRVIAIQRSLELAGRVMLQASSRRRTAWLAGTAALTVAKVLDNMEIGHNVLHGQWDWMRDPRIHSSTWEWDYATPAALWKRSHNEGHHRFTNILGMDNDLGYGILRVDEAQPWQPRHVFQPVLNLLNAIVFEYGIAAYDLELGRLRRGEADKSSRFREDLRLTLAKARRQASKDFVVFPLLSGRAWRQTLLANVTANVLRNVWSHSVIMCGHFPEGVETFEQESIRADESRGDWYLRQMLGSADITGPRLLHVLTGNLSHQIEHHLFPDLPSNRYGEIAPQVRSTVERFGLRYHARSMPRQVASAWHKVLRLSLPNGWLARHGVRRLRRSSSNPLTSPGA